MPTTFPFGRVRPIMLRVVVVSLVVAAVVAIVSIATAQFGETSWRLIGTAVLFTAFALFSWYDADVSSRRSSVFALVSFAVSVYLFVAGMLKIWAPPPVSYDSYGYTEWSPFDGFLGWVLLAVIARIALLHVHLVLIIGARLQYRVMSVVTTVTLVLVGTLAVLLTLPVLFSWSDVDESYWRAVGVVAVLDALGTVLVPLGYQLFAGSTPRAGSGAGAPPPVTGPGAVQPTGAGPVPPTASWTAQRGGGWTTGVPGPVDGTGASSAGFRPPAEAYARPGQRTLQWPRYEDGTLLPAGTDGAPDFRGVVGYDDWSQQDRGDEGVPL